MNKTNMFTEIIPRTNHVNLTDFQGSNDTEKFRAAADWLASHPGSTLFVPPGKYTLTTAEARKFMEEIFDGKYGDNPYFSMFTRTLNYVSGINFFGIHSCTIEAYGVTLYVDGFMEPITICGCHDFEIKGLSLDMKRRAYSSGSVVKVGNGYFDVLFKPNQDLLCKKSAAPRFFFYDKRNGNITHHISANPISNKKVSSPQEGVLRYRYNIDDSFEGCDINVAHSWHSRPAIFINESQNIRITDVKIHSHPGMGVVAHRSKDMFFNRLMVVPAAGELLSTNTDATHFVSCEGKVRFENCFFDGQGDDSLNIHSFFLTIIEKSRFTPAELAENNYVKEFSDGLTFTRDANYTASNADIDRPSFFMGDRNAKGYCYTIGPRPRSGTHSQKLDHPNPGDILNLVRLDTLSVVGEYHVLSVYCDPHDSTSTVMLDHDIPPEIDLYKFVNQTQRASLDFVSCHIRNHLARGILIRTRDTLIESCSFERCFNSAIHIASEIFWHECGASENITIRNNRMYRCSEPNGISKKSVSGISIYSGGSKNGAPCEGGVIHKNISITDNIIHNSGTNHSISACGVDGLTICRNECTGDIKYYNCQNVTAENNISK